MKKLMTAMLGLSLLTGLATVSFARADDSTDTSKTKTKKAKKAKKAKKDDSSKMDSTAK
jgi:hypothetical protein